MKVHIFELQRKIWRHDYHRSYMHNFGSCEIKTRKKKKKKTKPKKSDQLPVGLITHLVQHCTGIAEVNSIYTDIIDRKRGFNLTAKPL